MISQYAVLGAVIRPVQVWKSSHVNMSYITVWHSYGTTTLCIESKFNIVLMSELTAITSLQLTSVFLLKE